MKLPFSGRAASLVVGIVIVSLLIGGATSYLFLQKSAPVIKFPPLAKQADLPTHPLETFAASRQITLPSDNSSFVNSSCPTLSPGWVEEENKKPGVKMSATAWKSLDLSAAEGSALWLNQTAVSCGAPVDIHAALYSSNSTPQTKVPRTFAAWRIGYYNGAGAREVWRSSPIKLKKGVATTADTATRYTEADWPTVTSFTVGDNWTPGLYLIISFSAFGQIENAAPLIVRAPVGGLIDWAILGSADRHMAMAMIGLVGMSAPGVIHGNYKKLLDEFQNRCEDLKLGYVHGTIVHHWHGSLENRKYKERWQILTENKFDPKKDIQVDTNGLVQFTQCGLRIENEIMKYFTDRREDS